MLNVKLIETLQKCDIVLLAGEALSHCISNTITDIANEFGDDNIKKLVLLDDATSNVKGFENLGINFMREMKQRGMQVSDTENFF